MSKNRQDIDRVAILGTGLPMTQSLSPQLRVLVARQLCTMSAGKRKIWLGFRSYRRTFMVEYAEAAEEAS